MADLTPFVTPAEKLVEEIGALREEQKRIEESMDRRKAKLREIMVEKKVSVVTGPTWEAKIEVRKGGVDFSQKAFAASFGEEALADLEKTLPKRADTEALVIRATKKGVEDVPASGRKKIDEINSFFSK